MRIWTEAEMKNLVQTNDKVLYSALKALYGEQTAEEQASFGTTETNGRGFSKVDAGFLTSCAQFLIKRGFLTDKQKAVVRKKLVKYNKQITRLANAFEGEKPERETPVAVAVPVPVEASRPMTRNEYDIQECWDEETREFDWEHYQHLCDIAEYWGCEE